MHLDALNQYMQRNKLRDNQEHSLHIQNIMLITLKLYNNINHNVINQEQSISLI